MGCCGSSDDAGPPGSAPKTVAAGVPEEFAGERPPYLPFVPRTPPEVEMKISSSDEIYLVSKFGTYMNLEGDVDVRSTNSEPSDEAGIILEVREDETGNGPVMAGMEVSLRFTASRKQLNCDTGIVKHKNEIPESDADWFIIYKVGRPLRIAHGDSVYIQSRSLYNYVDVNEADCGVRCRWYKRGPAMKYTILRRKVVDAAASITGVQRGLQFDAFDLDGNGSISKSEMAYIMGSVDKSNNTDEMMAQADPEAKGHITREEFDAWAESIPESSLHHAQVLGNVAQRCNDCIHEEDALIEVLAGGVPVDKMPEVVACYQTTFGEDLIDAVSKKASQKGGYWKTAICGLFEPQVDLWARCLNEAMAGLGTDEGSLLALVCTIPDTIRDAVLAKYKEAYGQTLKEHVDSETSFNFKKVLVRQCMEPGEARAQALYDAMAGLGTDESQIIRILTSSDLRERKELMKTFTHMFQANLLERVKGETSGDFQKTLVGILSAEEQQETEEELEADCDALDEAMNGWGTDEAKLITFLASKSPKQLEDIQKLYKKKFDKNLEERITSETSGYFQDTLQGLLRHPMKQLAQDVRACIEGWGTDDTGLITLLVHLPDYKRQALIVEYYDTFGRDILEDIANDTSGDYKGALLALVKPPPQVWAEALTGAMKGLGTSDNLLINFMVIAKENMQEVRDHFQQTNGKSLYQWIRGDTSGDYKNTLLGLAARDSEDELELQPIYWAQRLRDALTDKDTLIEVLTQHPAVVLNRASRMYQDIFEKTLKAGLEEKTTENQSWLSFSNYWKTAMVAQLDMPVERRARALNDAMVGFGTDENTLLSVVCTLPQNQHGEICSFYETTYGRSLPEHIESETSGNFKRVMVLQSMPKAEARAKCLMDAMKGWGTNEGQIVRVLISSTMKERKMIQEKYQEMYDRSLVEHVESETSGWFKNACVAILESTDVQEDVDLDADCDTLKEACDGIGTDEDAIIRVLAGKTPQQVKNLSEKWEEKFPDDGTLLNRIQDETNGLFDNANFKDTLVGLLRLPLQQLVRGVRWCMEGWGTCDIGLITLLLHLSEAKRMSLIAAYAEVFERDLIEDIKSDCSGDYETSLIALVAPPPETWAKALRSSMAGLGTSDMLLINWMCIAKDRMDEVLAAFEKLNDGQKLADWIEGDCSADYAQTLVTLANRKCLKFPGSEAGLLVPAPLNPEAAIKQFRSTFITCCCEKKRNADVEYALPEMRAQEMGGAFMYYAMNSSCAPDLDESGLWDFTNAIGPNFAPGDDNVDLRLTFMEWDLAGDGGVSWNDFCGEMQTRINDPNYWDNPTCGMPE